MVVGIASAVCSIVGIGFLGYLVVLARNGTDDRAQADADRRFHQEHGHWPDEPPLADQKAGDGRAGDHSPPSGP